VPDARGALVWATEWLSAGRGVEPYSYIPVSGLGESGYRAQGCRKQLLAAIPPKSTTLIRPRPLNYAGLRGKVPLPPAATLTPGISRRSICERPPLASKADIDVWILGRGLISA
jgi:hypothetical protein